MKEGIKQLLSSGIPDRIEFGLKLLTTEKGSLALALEAYFSLVAMSDYGYFSLSRIENTLNNWSANYIHNNTQRLQSTIWRTLNGWMWYISDAENNLMLYKVESERLYDINVVKEIYPSDEENSILAHLFALENKPKPR